MTTTAERQYPASWTLNQIRESQIIEILKDRHPESSDLIEELASVVSGLTIGAETVAVARPGELIMAAISGDLTADEGARRPRRNTQSESARSRNGRRIIDHLAQWIERTEGNARGRANRSSPSVLHQLVTPT